MSEQTEKFDAIIIGSGQGGNPLGLKLAERGERVALIESNDLGGSCINTGCTPTKTMVASAQVAFYAREAARWGVRTGAVSVDMATVMKRKQGTVMAGRTGWEKVMDGDKEPHLYRGRARFVGEKRVQVGGELLEGKKIFIDTGSTPTIPPIEGLKDVPFLTNVSILEVKEVPKHLMILGGSYIGLEFGQMFRRFGSEVTVIEHNQQILPREDEDIANELQKALEGEGMRFELGKKATRVRQEGGALTVTVEDDKGSSSVEGSHLLVAVGRTPATKDLDLEKAGVKTDGKGYIEVNDRLETSAADVWAIGDVKGGPAFTHISYNDYQIIYGNLYEGANLSTKTRVVPYAVFTDPALGRVGLTEKDARASGKKLKMGKVPMTSVARARERDETSGLMKIVIDAETDKVLGAGFLGSSGDETVQIISALIWADKPYTLLEGAIYIHPTFAEGLFGLMESVKEVG